MFIIAFLVNLQFILVVRNIFIEMGFDISFSIYVFKCSKI